MKFEGVTVELTTVTGAVNDIVTSSAIAIGGVWTYFKFIRGRTFAHRAELNILPSLEIGGDRIYLLATVTLKNTGLSRLPLNSDMKIMRLFRAASKSDDPACITEWKRITTDPILEQHDWLEAQETVTDTKVYSFHKCGPNDSNHAVYQLEALVGAPRRLITRKGTRWQARAVVFFPSGASHKQGSIISLTKAAIQRKGNRNELPRRQLFKPG